MPTKELLNYAQLVAYLARLTCRKHCCKAIETKTKLNSYHFDRALQGLGPGQLLLLGRKEHLVRELRDVRKRRVRGVMTIGEPERVVQEVGRLEAADGRDEGLQQRVSKSLSLY